MRPVIAAGAAVAILLCAGCASKTAFPPARVGLTGTVPAQSLAAGSNVKLPAFPNGASYDGQATITGRTSFAVAIDRLGAGHPVFAPTVLVGSPGQHITLVITNKTPKAHNFTVATEHIDKNIAVGATISVRVTFPTKGLVVFYCKFHAVDSQAGELITRS